MRKLIALARIIFAETFNRNYGASQSSKGTRRRFRVEALETRVLLSADVLAPPPWLGEPEPGTPTEIVQLTDEQIHGDRPADVWVDFEEDDEGEHEEEEDEIIILPVDDVVVDPELGPGTNLAVGLVGNEPTIAVNPLNPSNMAVAQFNNGSQTLKISLDGGSTFPIVRNAVLAPGQTFFQGDDSLAFDAAGRLFWSYLSGGTPTGPNVSVVQVNPTTGAIVGSPTLVATTNLDKEWLAADANPLSPFANNLYVVWHDFAQTNAPVRIARSIDHGVTWTTLPGNLSGPGEGFTWPSEVAVAPNGDVFVAWHTNTGATNGEVRMRRSTDGGLTFGPEIIPFPAGTAATTTNSGTGLANKIDGLHVWLQGSMQPRILIDPARPGNIYVVSVDDPDTFLPTNDPSDIVIARSTDNGFTWTRSTISQGLSGDSEFMPAASINASGELTVTWYDNRRHQTVADSLGGTHFLLDLFATTSFDGGLTFTTPVQVNDIANPFDPERGAPDRFGNHTLRIGEYNGVAYVNATVNAVWTGNTATGQQIYFDRYFTGLTVVSTVPGNGSVITTQPTTFTVNVSSPILPETVDATDFTVNGIAASSVSYIPGTTAISFSFGSTPVTAQGLQTMHIGTGAFARASDGDPLRQFDGTFRYDTVLLQVTSTAPPVGGVFTLPGPFTYDVNFNEAVDPASVQASDLQLSGISGALVSGVTVLPGNASARFSLIGINTEGTLAASIGAGAITDVFGNPGAAFSGTYAIDFSIAPYPAPLTAKNPLGSLIYDPIQLGSINFAGDVDTFTLNIDPNQTISLVLTPTVSSLQPRIELLDSNNVLQGSAGAAAPGQVASIQTAVASLGGVYAFKVSGVGSSTGAYTLQVILNSDVELEGKVPGVSNDTPIIDGLTLNAIDSGWITAEGLHTTTNNNYIVGQSVVPIFPPPPPPVPLTEFRDYFTFSLPSATPTIVGAELRLFNPVGYNSPDTNETYSLFDVASFTAADLDVNRTSENQTGKDIHTDLGNGTVYGTRVVSAADNNTTVVIPLNSNGLAALNAAIGSTISFGGALTTLAGTATQLMFGSTTGAVGQVQLVLQTATPVITAQNIDSSFITLSTPQVSAERGAVLGQTDLSTTYTASVVPFAFEDISATGTVLTGLTNQDDAIATILGFNFPFFGVTNASVSVSSNGLLTFGGGNTSGVNSDLTVLPPQAAIAPFWDNLHTGGGVVGSNVLFQIIGTGADRHMTVQWNKVRFQTGGTAGDTITFQAQLYADGRIRFNYLDLVSVGAAGNNGASATVGIKGVGTQGPNRVLLAFNNGPNSFVNTGISTLFTLSAPLPDYYAFSLNAGETATLAATVQAAGNLTVELRDSNDAILATGIGGSANLTSVISDFTASVGGTYFARISGGDGITNLPYSLVVTRNAALDKENNNSAATAQTLDANHGVLGYAAGSSSVLYGATRAGQLFTINLSTGAGTLVGNLPIQTTEIEFDNQTGRAFAQAPDGSFFGQEFNINTATGIGATISNGASFNGMEWVGSTLYATAIAGPGGSSTLRTLNPFTGTSTTIGLTGFGPIAGLAFDPLSGIMYGITGGATGNLLRLNLTTGAATLIGPTGFRAGSLEVGPDGLLYGGGTNTDEFKIFRINPATGASTLVGTTGIGVAGTADITGLALVGTNGDDWYAITVPSAGNPLRLETSTPGDGPREFVNTFNPKIELYDNTGTTLVASGVAMPDGRNESIVISGLTPGATYKVRVTGESGTKGEYFLTRNFSPVVTNVTTSAINENDTATVTGTFSDPDSLDTHTVVITWGSGEGSTTLTLAAGVFAFSATHQYLDDNPTGTVSDVYPISVTVTDNHSASGSGGVNLTVNNVAPVVGAISGPSSGVRGQSLDFSGSFTDVGSLDTHQVKWDFGDGTVIAFHSTTDPNALTPSSHIFTANGVYTVTLSILDDDGGLTSVTRNVTITAVAIQTDPCDPDKTALVVGGTTANDIISFTPQGNNGNIIVSINGISEGIFHPTGHLIVYGQDGDDDIQVAGSIPSEAWLYGDAGNDYLKGGAGASILFGGDGDDELKGGTGRNILIGGHGRDRVIGGSDEDILIGGFVNFSRNAVVLCTLMEEWNSPTDAYALRVTRLRLHLNGSSVFDDDEVDILTGASGLDWFLDGEGDVITRLQDGEISG